MKLRSSQLWCREVDLLPNEDTETVDNKIVFCCARGTGLTPVLARLPRNPGMELEKRRRNRTMWFVRTGFIEGGK